tara:strand:+ start:43 stop:162 length:120 start_codon:yes stop_codon:yes gene_type:complete
MIEKIFIIIIACMFFLGCGVKDRPEYKSQDIKEKIIQIV